LTIWYSLKVENTGDLYGAPGKVFAQDDEIALTNLGIGLCFASDHRGLSNLSDVSRWLDGLRT
jgi:hypothetical protein